MVAIEIVMSANYCTSWSTPHPSLLLTACFNICGEISNKIDTHVLCDNLSRVLDSTLKGLYATSWLQL